MNTKGFYLTLTATALIAFTVKADDFAWGSTTAGTIALIDATTGLIAAPPGGSATDYNVSDSAGNNLGGSLSLAQNSSGTLYGLDNNGKLYTITTVLVSDRNKNLTFTATLVNSSVGVNNTKGTVFVSADLLDISTGDNLYQYNLTTQISTKLGSFNNANIAGLGYNGLLFGVQFSPSPGAIELISGVNLSPLKNSSFQGASGNSSMFLGSSFAYLLDGNNSFYSYNFVTSTLASIPNNFKAVRGNILSMTPSSSTGGGGTPTPTPTPTPIPTPTPTPTATPTATYALPTGTLTVTAPETTPQLQCAPGYQYGATESSSIPNGGTFDPHGSLGVYRFSETASSNGTFARPPATTLPALQLLSAVAANDQTWPANSGFANNRSFGPYTAAQDCNGVALGDNYGRETLALVYTLGDGTQYVLDTKVIYLYPWSPGSLAGAPTASIANAITNGPVQGNPSPYAAPSPSPFMHGDPPRVTVQMKNLYPAGTSSVIIYSGTPVSNPTCTGYRVIANTAATAPTGGLWTNRPAVTFELAPTYVSTTANTPQTYTIAALQQLPAGYGNNSSTTTPINNPAVLNTVTFTFASGFSVNGTVGTVK
jgi:hypothetical protein